MQVDIEGFAQVAVMRLKGRFDASAHREFQQAVDELMAGGGNLPLEVDLSNVGYIDSSALGMLLALRERALGAGREFRLCAAAGSVRQVLQIASFGKLFTIR